MTNATASESFTAVYDKARELYHDDSHSPHDPVVRRGASGSWSLESALLPADDGCIEFALETFHQYFHEVYSDGDYRPSEQDEEDFAAMTNERLNPMLASDLAELCEILTSGASVSCDMTSLPTFGGTEPDSTEGVFSWDSESLLIQSQFGWEIIGRDVRIDEDQIE